MKLDTLAERIKTRREEIGLQPIDLAYAAGVTVAAVMQWESGLTKALRSKTLFAVADALNVTPRWLENGDGQKEAAPARKAYKVAIAKRDMENDDRVRLAWDRIAACFARAAMAGVAAFAALPYLEVLSSCVLCQIARFRPLPRGIFPQPSTILTAA